MDNTNSTPAEIPAEIAHLNFEAQVIIKVSDKAPREVRPVTYTEYGVYLDGKIVAVKVADKAPELPAALVAKGATIIRRTVTKGEWFAD